MIQSLLSDCGCNKNNVINQGIQSHVQVIDHNTCAGVTVELLEMYKRPLVCCSINNLWAAINLTSEQLIEYINYLETAIQLKADNPETCEGLERLSEIQTLSNLLIKKRLCI